MSYMNKVIVVAGPTATGKTNIAIDLALQYNGEVISADSRQVYRGLDIGSAKVTKEEMRGVPHYMLDVAEPTHRYSVAEYQAEARKYIEDIINRGKVPIICGGTGFYIDSIIYDQSFPDVPPNEELRKKLEQKDVEELFELLQTKDPNRASTIDPHNKVRLVRALEITEALGSVPKQNEKQDYYDILYLCLELERETHFDLIDTRIEQRIEQGMLDEVQNLHNQGVSYEQLESFGLEYRYLSFILQGLVSEEEGLAKLSSETKKFVKRQYTWFRKNPKVQWFNTLFEKEALMKQVATFLSERDK
jgi:tRNA dimethylallyltransferase